MEEQFDEYGPEGEPTGRVVPRSEAHCLGWWHRSCHLWLVNAARDQVLLQRRDPRKETDPGRWDIAVAGHVSAGQTLRQTVVREAFEELGLRLDEAELDELGRARKEYVDPEYIDREWQFLFAGQWDGDVETLTPQPGEVTDIRWMPLADYRAALERGDPAYVGRWEDWPAFARWAGLAL